ncbi:uncharacterized protein EDB91DRAFT_1088451 [Suillus paluster]|uniref:uncharacterized protein n=1 Tax=Suillus paluster TaxID=48578 RepID=UPI001B884C4E|nr:uncharacterized protein EDB91DRAFT_1088451 [Suillus paluster]KAG1721424.1 hypothetical protein EDB91DRAFT_1088451 [Suillus paluster]
MHYWLFLQFNELPEDSCKNLEADPLHPENKALFISERSWEANEKEISMMHVGADTRWMTNGLDISAIFKKHKKGALSYITDKSRDGINLPYNEEVALPDRWLEHHEPPIRFMSPRKDMYLRAGNILHKPLLFLFNCLSNKPAINPTGFLCEIMDILYTNKRKEYWSVSVDALFEGELSWKDFGNLLTEELDLGRMSGRTPQAEIHMKDNDSVGSEYNLPFLPLNARTVVQALKTANVLMSVALKKQGGDGEQNLADLTKSCQWLGVDTKKGIITCC